MQGPVEERIIRECLREKRDFPKAIANAPSLSVGLGLYYEAFSELETCRGDWGGPIPWTAIDAYCRRMEITGDQFSNMVAHIRAMDRAISEWRAEQKQNK